jgi:hypothetical protein
MNSLAKIFFKNILLIVLFAPFFCRGQNPVFGIKLGLALSNSTIEYANSNPYNPSKTSTRTGIIAGGYVDFSCGKKIIFRPAMELVAKGMRLTGYGYDNPILFSFVDFPINILYKIDFAKGHAVIGGGPSIGIPLQDGYGMYPLKKEFGVNGLIGYEMAVGFSLNLNYSYGLSNASKNKDSFKKISNRYFGITLGYAF